MMKNRQPHHQPDLDSIEELNYISTIEEDAVIDAHIEDLRGWGYGSIVHSHVLHQLFWEFTRRGIILDKLFRVAVVECIDEETLYTKFLGMAKRYNAWAKRHQNEEAMEQRDFERELAEKDSVIEKVRKDYRESQETVGKLRNEIAALKLAAKPKSKGQQTNDLRHELKKEYNQKLQLERHKAKPDKLVSRAFLGELRYPGTLVFEAFDLTRERDIKEYIGWFRLGGRKINEATRRSIIERYGEQDINMFLTLAAQYNTEWEAGHPGELDSDDNN